MLTDYHVHMIETGDFSTAYLQKYVHQAQRVGIKELGISEHAYFFEEAKDILTNEWAEERRAKNGQKMKDYLALFEEAKQEGLPVKMAIEMDYIPGKEKEMEDFINAYPFDYVIGSVHWIDEWGIDLAIHRYLYDERDLNKAYKDYFDQIISLAESKLFDFVGHLDLIKIFKFKPSDPDFVEEQYDRVVKALAQSGTSIEISTAGLRKPVGEIYPTPLLLQKCYEAGVTIVLSSDAHEPEHVGYAYGQSLQLAQEVGYTEVQVFTGRKKEAYPLG